MDLDQQINNMNIAIDFDGTCVKHEYPYVGQDIGAVPVLKKLVEKGHNLILFTMRCDQTPDGKKGYHLQDAINWFKDNNIPLHGVQYNPTQHNWTTSNKCYAHLYIDDAALGCPLKQDWIDHPDGHYSGPPVVSGRPYVDWEEVENILKRTGVL